MSGELWASLIILWCLDMKNILAFILTTFLQGKCLHSHLTKEENGIQLVWLPCPAGKAQKGFHSGLHDVKILAAPFIPRLPPLKEFLFRMFDWQTHKCTVTIRNTVFWSSTNSLPSMNPELNRRGRPVSNQSNTEECILSWEKLQNTVENLRRKPNPAFEVWGFLEEGTSKMEPRQLEIIKMTLGFWVIPSLSDRVTMINWNRKINESMWI